MFKGIWMIPAAYHANMGRSDIISFTFSRTEAITAGFSGLESTVSIISTMGPISSSFRPRVVMAGGAETDTGGEERRTAVEGNHVFVGSDVGLHKHAFSHLTCKFGELGAKVNEHAVVVCAARNHLVALCRP